MSARVSLRSRVAVAAIALMPTLAFANAGIGYFMIALPIVVLALIPAIPLEALVLQAILRLSLQRALSLSLWANLQSTFIGLVLGIAIDVLLMAGTGSAGPEPTKGAATAMLVPLFLFSWWIEHRAIRRRATDLPGRRVALATGAANLLSYAAMLAFVWTTAFLPERSTMSTRAQVSEAVLAASGMKSSIAEFWERNKRFPTDSRELGSMPLESKTFRVTVESGGRISVQILMLRDPDIDGKRIILTPVPGDGELRWNCSAPDIPPRLLPSACRR